ncbi:MAG TPA: cyclic nucleotide-binding domain-containing protein, partial [Azospirillaceae bacterium]|nr:cyclic nucleotide-binding domain-containing protein [Azospirillaceae bacterium]
MSVWAGLIDSAKLGQRRLAAGEGLFRQGDTAIAIYAVEQGRVRLVRHLEDGSTVAVHVVRAGETF